MSHATQQTETVQAPDRVGASMGSPLWWITKDGDNQARQFFDRHYSRQFYRDGRQPKLFCGPGQKIVLRTWGCDALFVWRKFKDASGQTGINCAVFRNESPYLASKLVRQADAIADFCWPGERHYTFVDARRIRSTNPGCCFKAAGWHQCGRTKGGLLIFERKPKAFHYQLPAAPSIGVMGRERNFITGNK